MSAVEIARLRDEIVGQGSSLFSRGLASGSSGNISVRLDDGSMLLTPTNSSLGALSPGRIAHLAADGTHLSGDPASKEAFLHRAIYLARTTARAVVHLHATHSAAVSCMVGLDPMNCLPPLTAYHVMKVGRLPLIPYHRPGDPSLAPRIAELAPTHPALLLANHGPIVAGVTLAEATNTIEELEETARLFLLLRGAQTRPLSSEQIEDLGRTLGDANRKDP